MRVWNLFDALVRRAAPPDPSDALGKSGVEVGNEFVMPPHDFSSGFTEVPPLRFAAVRKSFAFAGYGNVSTSLNAAQRAFVPRTGYNSAKYMNLTFVGRTERLS